MDLNAVKLLARVAETRSFTQAAVSLGLTQSGLSRAIGRLEAELGVRLLHRTTRSVSLTPDGQLFYERCAPLLAELEEVEKLLVDRQCAPSGPLKITTPQALGRIVIMPVLRELTRRYPQLQIEAAMTDRLVDLTEEGFDAAVRLGRVGDVRLIARPLAALRWVTVASPEYLRGHGTPERLEQLAGHNCPTVRDLHTGKLLEWQFQRDGQPLSL
ncbi:LysR family transcriptional regulator, partial [Pseudomonas aeruginosa]